MNPPRCKTKRKLNALSIARLMDALMDGPCTTHELVAVSGLSLGTVRHYVLTLHRESVAYIAHWEQNSRGAYTTPAYMLGRKRDAIKPVMGASERNKAWRARRRQIELIHATAGHLAA